MVVVTGSPNCTYCTMLEVVVAKLVPEFTKVDITENPEYFSKVKEGGNKMPACIFVGDARYIVSNTTPAKIPNVKKWLEEQGL